MEPISQHRPSQDSVFRPESQLNKYSLLKIGAGVVAVAAVVAAAIFACVLFPPGAPLIAGSIALISLYAPQTIALLTLFIASVGTCLVAHLKENRQNQVKNEQMSVRESAVVPKEESDQLKRRSISIEPTVPEEAKTTPLLRPRSASLNGVIQKSDNLPVNIFWDDIESKFKTAFGKFFSDEVFSYLKETITDIKGAIELSRFLKQVTIIQEELSSNGDLSAIEFEKKIEAIIVPFLEYLYTNPDPRINTFRTHFFPAFSGFFGNNQPLSDNLLSALGTGYNKGVLERYRNATRENKYHEYPPLRIHSEWISQLELQKIGKVDNFTKGDFHIKIAAGNVEKECRIPIDFSEFSKDMSENKLIALWEAFHISSNGSVNTETIKKSLAAYLSEAEFEIFYKKCEAFLNEMLIKTAKICIELAKS